MDTSKLVLYGAFCFINSTALCFIVWYVMAAYKSIKGDLNLTIDYLKYIADQSDIVYINHLDTMRRELLKEERYEDASKIDHILQNRIKRFNEMHE
jgi:hypothetical protein|nr:MAG TPA: hypothetical protein [Caudoviricetes sp.]